MEPKQMDAETMAEVVKGLLAIIHDPKASVAQRLEAIRFLFSLPNA